MKICIFPNDPILAYYKKGEIKERYYNPNNFFDEIHFIIIDEDGEWTGTKGAILEIWEFLSKASDAKNSNGSSNYYVDVLNN